MPLVIFFLAFIVSVAVLKDNLGNFFKDISKHVDDNRKTDAVMEARELTRLILDGYPPYTAYKKTDGHMMKKRLVPCLSRDHIKYEHIAVPRSIHAYGHNSKRAKSYLREPKQRVDVRKNPYFIMPAVGDHVTYPSFGTGKILQIESKGYWIENIENGSLQFIQYDDKKALILRGDTITNGRA